MKFESNINGHIVSPLNIEEQSFSDPAIKSFLRNWFEAHTSITVYTSGSTGKPKPITLLKSDMLASARLTCNHFGLKEGDSALLCLPSKYIAGKMMLVRGIERKLNIISVPPSSNPLEEIDQAIDFAAMTPMQVKSVIKENPEKMNLIKQLIIGGAPVDHLLESALQNFSTICYSTFGMTETVTHIAIKKLNKADRSGVFTALGDVKFELGDRNNLIIHTPHLSLKKHKTNDTVEIIDDKNFIWKGRIDNVINSGGIKLQPEMIEQKIQQIIPNHRFFVSSSPSEQFGEQLVLVVEAAKEISQLPYDLKLYLESFEVPKVIHYITQFIETPTGKVDRKSSFEQIQ